MKQYIGTKMVKAAPALRLMDGKGNNRIELLSSNPMPLPGDSVEEGYKVVYEDGYESWSPTDVFEAAYRETTGMPFGLAIEAAKKGKKIARAGWNGKGMYVFLAPGEDLDFRTPADLSELAAQPQSPEVGDMLVLRTAQAGVQPGWLASQADMLSDDWEIVED